jgi:H2-forming N5,N10-methylenetetrahydromethanopterin dehydrogenase-like enzyme
LPENKPNNPFDPWSFLPFSSNTIFPESDSDVEKKIKELKIIETWLNFNLEFTRSVIKTMEIKTEALNTLKDFSKSHKNKGMDEFVDAMNKKIISSSVRNAENWWKSLETQMGNFIDQTMQETTEQSVKKRNVKRTPSKGSSKTTSGKKK